MDKKMKIMLIVGIIAVVLYLLWKKGKDAAAIAAATTGDKAGTNTGSGLIGASGSQAAGTDSIDDAGILPSAVTATIGSSGKTYPVQGYVPDLNDGNVMVVSLPHEAAADEGITSKTSKRISDTVTISGGPYAGQHTVWYVYWDERPGVTMNLYTRTPYKG